MDEAVAPPAEEQEPAPSRRGDRWTQLRELRKDANRNRSGGEWLDLGISAATTAGTYVLIGLGFSTSYSTIREIAQDKGGFSPQMSHVVPLAFEGGIIILSMHVIREARRGKRALLLRLIVSVCSLATLLTNWSASTTVEGKLTHVVPVAMFIICFEWLIHAARQKALEDMGLLPPPVAVLRAAEWTLDFPNAFARWRLMALHGIHSPEQALWVRQQLALRRSELEEAHNGSWRAVPKHVKLRMRIEVLTDAESRFAPASENPAPGRYSSLAAHLPATQTPAVPAPRSGARPELENPDEQTALPPGVRSAEASYEGDSPYAVGHTDLAPVLPSPQDHEPRMAHAAPRARTLTAGNERGSMAIESYEEREQREERERLEQHDHDRRMNETYRSILDVIADLASTSEPVNGARIAEDPRVPVSARSVQRHLKTMKEKGLLPDDLIQ
ncbi:DUF2637 domain-containing protein [Streptomyces sp. NPDC047065]|uniref:DUF2637 domain-containing protein n=1 Tax=Streptomyces sp. NPDC047065 TaxID=3154606 RepID=UPI0033FCBF98